MSTRADTSRRWDLSVVRHVGSVAAAIELKTRPFADEGQAVAVAEPYRRAAGDIDFFLLITPTALLLWTRPATDGMPALRMPFAPVVSRFVDERGDLNSLSGAQFEMIVMNWLSELATKRDADLNDDERRLSLVGFVDALRGGKVIAQSIAA